MTPAAPKRGATQGGRKSASSKRKPAQAKRAKARPDRTAAQSQKAQSQKAQPQKTQPQKTQPEETLGRRMDKLVGEMVAKGIRLQEAQDQLERLFLAATMAQCGGNQCRAAEQLRMHRNTLRRKLERHVLL